MKLLGAKTFTFGSPKSTRKRFPLTLVLSRGHILQDAKMHREVRFGKYYVDFANDLNWIIEIDGTHWHMDVVADMDREIYINELVRKSPYGWRLLRIKAPRIWNDPAGVRAQVLEFITK